MSPESDTPRGPFARFLQHEAASSVLLLACTVTALAWANSPWSAEYEHLLHTEVGFWWGEVRFALSLRHWVNDALMAIFFFVVGLEIKREIAIGQLSSLKSAALPVAGALGGMLLPALIYTAFNAGGPGARGWGVPMATDIAFALGILALVGKRVPPGLKLFLTALAIADDLAAVLVIALFYSEQIVIGPLLTALSLLAIIFVAGRLGVRQTWLYGLLVIGVWLATFASGIHATVAGILVAMVVPVKARIDPGQALTRAVGALGELQRSELSRASVARDRRQFEFVQELHEVSGDLLPAGLFFEKALHPVTAFFILPLFALFNAGVVLGTGLGEALAHPVSLGILGGLLVGKQVGIALACFIAVKLGFGELPRGVKWIQLYGVGILAGIGFTMSLFISDLALPTPSLIAQAKVAILAAAILAAAIGFTVLSVLGRKTAVA